MPHLFAGVFDGHGPCGAEIAHFAQTFFLGELRGEGGRPQEQSSDEVVDMFSRAQIAVTRNPDFDATISGTSATLVQVNASTVCVACVGNCTAVVAQRGVRRASETDTKPRFHPKHLGGPHDFLQQDERRRVKESGGQVRPVPGESIPRAFHAGKMYPGIALSRTLGDTLAHQIGILAEPEVKTVEFHDQRAFLIVASDGLWENFPPEKAVATAAEIIRTEGAQAAALALARRADEFTSPDDLTVLVVSLSHFKRNRRPSVQSI
jgi:serine/threonine protein phosphatase PrpC